MRQSDMILRYLREEGSITPLDALREFGPSPIHRMSFLKKLYG